MCDKSRIKLFKINGICMVIKYDNRPVNNYEIYYEGEVSSGCSKLYIYNTGSQCLFGEYVEYRNTFKEFDQSIICHKIFNFMLNKMTNFG